MKIEYLGHSCFRIESVGGLKIVTDPYTKVGYEMLQGLTADLVTVSHGHFDHNYTDGVEGDFQVIDCKGAYEFQGVTMQGAETWHDSKQGALRGKNLIFTLNIDGVKICHFGDLGESYSEKIAKILKDTDLWLLPVGGTYTIDADEAKEYIEKLQPKAVIPMHYRPQDGRLDIATSEVFLQKMKDYPIVACLNGVLSFTKEDLEEGKTKIFYMERKK